MEPNADQSQIRSALKDVVCADPDVVFTVVFGSQLSGTATHSSDFDIAVNPNRETTPARRLESLTAASWGSTDSPLTMRLTPSNPNTAPQIPKREAAVGCADVRFA
ncbi:nucleotidyltransferase domain-containing protein [Halorubrum sp. Atlit-8R]|jgi:hypothetical protein|uniref:nucleotidyltransferase domain-containing protein n=1 Tax=unclassified Halorubrum TaxID=2642239 RepID=UPI000EF1CD36|nr:MULTISPECIES: nucleotidyltransferase domain-containing protein [unclassified Halorubrum]RLM67568.1 nucleotidyltransferase domain-containing protein [Halorubrum sp. Atlit-9R]RLM77726.1 nucleotidyltransferase domain-containing protein [Halorubrum sp. Atlit-8R]